VCEPRARGCTAHARDASAQQQAALKNRGDHGICANGCVNAAGGWACRANGLVHMRAAVRCDRRSHTFRMCADVRLSIDVPGACTSVYERVPACRMGRVEARGREAAQSAEAERNDGKRYYTSTLQTDVRLYVFKVYSAGVLHGRPGCACGRTWSVERGGLSRSRQYCVCTVAVVPTPNQKPCGLLPPLGHRRASHGQHLQ
jgi:hypothetical protein